MKTTNFSSYILAIIVGCLMVSVYLQSVRAQSPTAAPPQNNLSAPINVGTTTQVKPGDLVLSTLAAFNQVRSNRYCDALGNNCGTGTTTNVNVLRGEATAVFAGPADKVSIGATATFTIAFGQTLPKVPTINLFAKDFVGTSTYKCDPILVTKTNSGITVFYRVYSWNHPGNCVLPNKLNWIAVSP